MLGPIPAEHVPVMPAQDCIPVAVHADRYGSKSAPPATHTHTQTTHYKQQDVLRGRASTQAGLH